MISIRDRSIDIIKGIAIFFVLWGHSIQCIGGDKSFFSNWMIKFIYSFHMPLFMTISGYLFFRSCHKNLITIIKNRLKSLGIPFVVWNLLLYLRLCIFRYMTTHDFGFNLLEGLKFLVSGLWFLSSLFIITILTAIIVKVFYRYKYIISAAAYIGLILLSNYVGDHTADLFPFFIFGFSLAEHNKFFEKIYEIRFGVYALFIILLMFFKDYYYVYVSGINLFTSDYGIWMQMYVNTYRLMIGASGSIAVITLIKSTYKCWNKIIKGFFEKLGECSLQIYVMQSFLLEGVVSQIIERLPKIGETLNNNIFLLNLIITPIVTIIYSVLLLFSIKVIARIPGLSFILFGRKVTIINNR